MTAVPAIETQRLWLPRWYTDYSPDAPSDGPDAIDFAHSLLHLPNDSIGHRAGEPLLLTDWQQWAINGSLALTPEGRWKHNRAIIGVARRNGKSLLTSTIGLYALLLAGENDLILAAAGDRQQARIIFDAARWQVENSPALARACKVTKSEIVVRTTGARWRTVSSDSRLIHGLGPRVVTFDELHVQRNDEMWSAFATSGSAREEQLIIGISTAGHSLDSLLGELYLHGRQVSTGEVEDPGLFFAWWEPSKTDCDIRDSDALRQASPNLAEGLISEDTIVSASHTMDESQFRRYFLNQWAAVAGSTLVPWAEWRRAVRQDGLAPREEIALAFDGSLSDDATALIGVSIDTGVMEVLGLWEPHGKQWRVDRDEVHAAVKRAFDTYNVRRMACDQAYWQHEIEEWAQEFGRTTVTAFPMTNARMGPATSEFLSDLTEGRIGHTDDQRFTRHVMNAEGKDSAFGPVPRKDSPGSPRKIDALVAAIMAADTRRSLIRRRGRAGGL